VICDESTAVSVPAIDQWNQVLDDELGSLTPAEGVAMIQVIEGLPEGVLAYQASGKVTADDYESTLIPAVEAASAGDDKIRFLLVFGADFEGYAADAALDDAKMGMHHWGDFERIAFVTDHSVERAAVKGFGFLMPGKVKVFPLGELDAAKMWVAE
jgi:SpoIIAA-like